MEKGLSTNHPLDGADFLLIPEPAPVIIQSNMDSVWIWLLLIGGIILIGLLLYRQRQSTSAEIVAPKSKQVAGSQPAAQAKQEEEIREETAVSPPPPLPEKPTGSPRRILVVDDMSVWANTIRQFSTLFHCEVRHASRLTAAVQELARWQPHLIILDLHMPRDPWQPIPTLRGKYAPDQHTLAFCEQVTTHPKLAHILVAITSVEEQAEQQTLARAAGAHYYFTKGEFNVEQLTQLLADVEKRIQFHTTPSPS